MEPLYTIKQHGESPKKLKTKSPYDPEVLVLGVYPKEMKTWTQNDKFTQMFIAALFTIAKT